MKNKKTYTTAEVMAELKKSLKKKQPVVNATLKKHIQSIVNKEIKKDCRAEAMRILLKANKKEVGDFLYSHYSDGTSAGLCCIALDFIKDRLQKDGLVGKNFGKQFGNKF